VYVVPEIFDKGDCQHVSTQESRVDGIHGINV
jgi:hypothetical protein